MSSEKPLVKVQVIRPHGDKMNPHDQQIEKYHGDLEETLINIAEKFNLNLTPKKVGDTVKEQKRKGNEHL